MVSVLGGEELGIRPTGVDGFPAWKGAADLPGATASHTTLIPKERTRTFIFPVTSWAVVALRQGIPFGRGPPALCVSEGQTLLKGAF